MEGESQIVRGVEATESVRGSWQCFPRLAERLLKDVYPEAVSNVNLYYSVVPRAYQQYL